MSSKKKLRRRLAALRDWSDQCEVEIEHLIAANKMLCEQRVDAERVRADVARVAAADQAAATALQANFDELRARVEDVDVRSMSTTLVQFVDGGATYSVHKLTDRIGLRSKA